jgi:ubiquinone/menaquinone biosynthesis C-methylase UbiE
MTDTFWDKRAGQYDKNMQKHDSLYAKSIASTTELLTTSDVVLDFACASGEMSLDIAPHVQQIHGIDLSAKMIELANQKADTRQVDNTRFDQMDVFDPQLSDSSFSAIIAFNIFHLLDDATAVLARLNGLLAPGRLLLSQTPCLAERGWTFRTLNGLAQRLGVAPTIHSVTGSELESLVSNSHFEIIGTRLWDAKNRVHWIVARKR